MASTTPKPTEIKKLQGTYRPDRSKSNRMNPGEVTSLPAPPEYLGEHGCELWNTQLQELINLKMLTKVDLVALGQYCKEWDLFRQAVDDINKNGFRNSYDQVSPAISLKNQAFKNMLQIADRYGFVAGAREKLSMPESKEVDPLEQHMAKIHQMNKQNRLDLETWVSENGVSKRVYNCLKSAGVKSYQELKNRLTANTLKTIKGIGAVSMKEIQEALE